MPEETGVSSGMVNLQAMTADLPAPANSPIQTALAGIPTTKAERVSRKRSGVLQLPLLASAIFFLILEESFILGQERTRRHRVAFEHVEGDAFAVDGDVELLLSTFPLPLHRDGVSSAEVRGPDPQQDPVDE